MYLRWYQRYLQFRCSKGYGTPILPSTPIPPKNVSSVVSAVSAISVFCRVWNTDFTEYAHTTENVYLRWYQRYRYIRRSKLQINAKLLLLLPKFPKKHPPRSRSSAQQKHPVGQLRKVQRFSIITGPLEDFPAQQVGNADAEACCIQITWNLHGDALAGRVGVEFQWVVDKWAEGGGGDFGGEFDDPDVCCALQTIDIAIIRIGLPRNDESAVSRLLEGTANLYFSSS